jgi:hypothetical protein
VSSLEGQYSVFQPALTGGKYNSVTFRVSFVKNSARYETGSWYHRRSGVCGSFFITLRLIEPEAPPQQLEDQRISHKDSPMATQNAGLARIDEILAQRLPTRTPKDSEAERQRFRAEAQSGHKILAKKHRRDKGGSTQQMDALLRKITKDD